MRSRPGWILGCVLAPALLLTACTSGRDPVTGSTPSATDTRPGTSALAEGELRTRVQSALDAVTDKGGSMVESGVERVSDGVHTRPGLAEGAIYKVTVVCAGKGAVDLDLTPAGRGSRKPVPCDGTVVFERFTAGALVRLEVRGRSGATGMIAWRVDKV